MTRTEIDAACANVGNGGTDLEKIAMERTREYLARSFADEEEIDASFITTVAGSYFDGVLDTLRTGVNLNAH